MSSEQIVPVEPSVLSQGSYDHIMRVAKMYSDSQLVPPAFQKNIPNVIIAMEIAQRINASPLMVFQNLNVIHGKPTFSATFMIATVNSCGRFTPMRFNYVGERDTDEWGCFATAKNRDGTELKGVPVTMAIAKAEGWITRTGSKWKTMPELMLSYRAATWWTRMYAPEMLMGFPTEDEVHDIRDVTPVQEDKPVVKVPKNKGVTAMKLAAAPEVKEPAKDTTTPADPRALKEDRAPEPEHRGVPHADIDPQESSIANSAAREMREPPPSAISAKEVVTPPQNGQPVLSRVRCEITGLTERSAKKKDGNGLVTLVDLKGEWDGQAYFDGAKGHLPQVGGIIDITLETRDHNNAKAYIIKSFQIVG